MLRRNKPITNNMGTIHEVIMFLTKNMVITTLMYNQPSLYEVLGSNGDKCQTQYPEVTVRVHSLHK
jgi:hypothetical protein